MQISIETAVFVSVRSTMTRIRVTVEFFTVHNQAMSAFEAGADNTFTINLNSINDSFTIRRAIRIVFRTMRRSADPSAHARAAILRHLVYVLSCRVQMYDKDWRQVPHNTPLQSLPLTEEVAFPRSVTVRMVIF